MRQIPIPQEIYRHFKGNLYQIITVAEHSETGEQMVVYQALYGSFKTYVRPLSMFMEKTDKEKYPEAEQEYRFERMDKEERSGVWPSLAVSDNGDGVSGSGEPQEPSGEESGNIDPMVIEFLDASSYEERMNILSGLYHRITDDMINIMSAALDIEVKPGEIEERYAEFRNCLALMERFECNRLR